MSKNSIVWLVVLSLVLMTTSVAAATRYVSDELSINLRRGPSNSYGIIQLLQAGTKVETLEEADGWTRVRTAGGREGYILTRFIASEPAARDRIEQVVAELDELKQENEELRTELSHEEDGTEKLGKLKRELAEENASLKEELKYVKQVSSEALETKKENREFREQILSMKSELERLESENKSLRSRREGMKIGALILLGGVVLGLILPAFRRRRKDSWSSL